jgi:hypothetical protein
LDTIHAGKAIFSRALFHDHINAIAACAVSSGLVHTKSARGITNVQTRSVTAGRRRRRSAAYRPAS